MAALVLLAVSLHIGRICLHGGLKQSGNEISSGKVCEILLYCYFVMMLSLAFLHCLQLQLMGLELRVPLTAALYRHRASSSKQSNHCCIQASSLHPEMELQGQLTRWEVDLCNYVTVDRATASTSSCPQ